MSSGSLDGLHVVHLEMEALLHQDLHLHNWTNTFKETQRIGMLPSKHRRGEPLRLPQ